MTVQWEYKIVKGVLSEERMNFYGMSGWELVAIVGNNNTFKRKKQ